MTEDEAKALICPTIRYCVNEDSVIQDGRSAIHVNANCQGRACMAWVFSEPETESVWRDHPRFTLAIEPDGDGWVRGETTRGFKLGERTQFTRPAPSRQGYCGLVILRPA